MMTFAPEDLEQTSDESLQHLAEKPTLYVPSTQISHENLKIPSEIPRSNTRDRESAPSQEALQRRYLLQQELGRGGVGVVYQAHDQAMQRAVALKSLKPSLAQHPDLISRFWREARITAMLEHPSVIPVYDLGTNIDGQPFYTMRVVTQRTLSEVLGKDSRAWSLQRLCAVFVQICRAIAYAHSRGVLHRDLKPHNILLGDYGEVYVADWGLAKQQEDLNELTLNGLEETMASSTMLGSFLGTPGYMSPEQAQGLHHTLDERSDIFSLGVILYEILTGQRPFQGETAMATIIATLQQPVVPPRQHVPSCPLVLEDLCIQMLQRDPLDRPSSAEDVAREIELFLEGSREKNRKEEKARQLVAQAAQPRQIYQHLQTEKKRILAEIKRGQRENKLLSLAEKRLLWRLEDEAKAIETQEAEALATAIELYAQALGYHPENRDARAGLASLYWNKARDAERQKDTASQIFYESLVLDYDDGTYRTTINAPALLSLDSPHPQVHIQALRYVERERVLTTEAPISLGVTPIHEAKLPPGNYLLLASREGYETTRLPVRLRRGETRHLHLRLYTQEQIGAGFVLVHEGKTLLGGDDEAYNALNAQEVNVAEIAIARLPVTFAEYLVFLNSIGGAAEQHLPRGNKPYVFQDEHGVWQLDRELLVRPEARKYCPVENAEDLPVGAIRWHDAVAYCQWRSEQTGETYRLPTEAEWERAIRGEDGRAFPWGDSFDTSFCKMRQSREGEPFAEPVGSFETDETWCGARDMAGGARSWSADIFGKKSYAQLCAEPESEHAPRVGRGGTWLGSMNSCRAASRLDAFSHNRFISLGIRLVKEL